MSYKGEADEMLYKQQDRNPNPVKAPCDCGQIIEKLQAENARLQGRGDDYKAESEVSFARARRAEALAERRKDALPALVFALAYSDYGEPGITVESCIAKWERYFKPALQEEHRAVLCTTSTPG